MTINARAIEEENRVLKVAGEFMRTGEQRPGQALMNALRYESPELYEIISGSLIDCFYDDSKVPAVMKELGYNRRLF